MLFLKRGLGINDQKLTLRRLNQAIQPLATPRLIFRSDKERGIMATTSKHHQTQWTGQYGVAHEMTRRGHLVTLTLGNAPHADLLCRSPQGINFSVQVKSLSSKTYFLLQDNLLTPNPALCFVLVFIPSKAINAVEYFVFNNQQFLDIFKEEEIRLKEMELKRGKPYAPFAKGINYGTVNRDEFRNAWNNVPK